MGIHFEFHGRKFAVHISGSPTLAERIIASDEVLGLLDGGYRSLQNPQLLRAKKRFRDQRLRGVERELQNDELLGLEVVSSAQFALTGPNTFVWRRPDRELLNWWSSGYVVEIVDGCPLELPTGIDGCVRRMLSARQVRALTQWSQSKLEKHADECPGLLKEPGRYGIAWAVDTIEFVRAFGDPKFPFMPPRWQRHISLRKAA